MQDSTSKQENKWLPPRRRNTLQDNSDPTRPNKTTTQPVAMPGRKDKIDEPSEEMTGGKKEKGPVDLSFEKKTGILSVIYFVLSYIFVIKRYSS